MNRTLAQLDREGVARIRVQVSDDGSDDVVAADAAKGRLELEDGNAWRDASAGLELQAVQSDTLVHTAYVFCITNANKVRERDRDQEMEII